MKTVVNSLDLVDPIDPRDSFFGGRTNAIRLHYKVKPGEEIRYVDFTSLYPWTNKTCRYPVGHPMVVSKDFKDLQNYFGIVKCQVLPPKDLFSRCYLFGSMGNSSSHCVGPVPRGKQMTAVSTTTRRGVSWAPGPVLQRALEKGYDLLKMYQVLHWPETTQYHPETKEGGLFSIYINTFLKLKQESSGFPTWCVETLADGTIRPKIEECKRYIELYFENEGIRLDWDMVKKNPGLRSLAKLCLNSLWGKLGQRGNLPRSTFFFKDQLDDFYQLLTDATKDVQNFNIMSDDAVHVSYKDTSEFVPVSTNTNIYLATFTTSWARLKLYHVLDTLGRDVLYHDTDSIIYICRPGQNEVPLGDYLGELTDELDGDYIVEFVSGGPKNYAYRTSRGLEKVCVKGFSLNFRNSQLINFSSIKDLMMDHGEEDEPSRKKARIETVNEHKINRDKWKCAVFNRSEKKAYRIVYTKRALNRDD